LLPNAMFVADNDGTIKSHYCQVLPGSVSNLSGPVSTLTVLVSTLTGPVSS
jgi:hypothetical protein